MNIVVSATAVFVLIWVVMRIVGKRELSEMAPFDLVILVVMGDLVAEAVIAEDTSVTGAVIAVATFAVLTVVVSWVSWLLPQHRQLFEGVPTLLIKNGEVIDEAMHIERLNLEDLLTAARTEGIRSLDDVE